MYGNPYLNPYGLQPQSFQQQYQQPMPGPQRQAEKVNGRNGASALPMGPNSSAWVLDESGVLSWLITTDSAGYKTISCYDVLPHQDKPEPDYGSLESRISKLEEMMGGMSNGTASNTTAVKPKPKSNGND